MAEKQRYYNPSTLIIEFAEPLYAAVTGLVLWEGDEAEVEIDKAGVTRAVLAENLEELKVDELKARAEDLGIELDPKAKKADIISQIEGHVESVESLNGGPAVGEQ